MSEKDWEDPVYWEDPAQLQEDYKRAFLLLLYGDMTEVMARVIDTPVYDIVRTELTEEWVNRAIREELVEANDKIRAYEQQLKRQHDLLKTAGGHIADSKPYMTSLLHPPPPWKEFGYHANHNPVPDVVFWGEDGTGLPIWERLTKEEE